jgi:hypothetical protein
MLLERRCHIDATSFSNFYLGFEFCLSRSDGIGLRDHARNLGDFLTANVDCAQNLSY